jgi:hypothetical protein
MMESGSGHVGLQRTESGEVIPVELLDAVEPFVDVPSNLIQNHRNKHPEEGLPRFDYIIRLQIIIIGVHGQIFGVTKII